MTQPACMGGWCEHRNSCAQHLQRDRRFVHERICRRGEETARPAVAASFLNRSGRVMRGAADVREAA